MTIDERIARIEHFLAGMDERHRREQEENRALIRELQQSQVTAFRRMATIEDNHIRLQDDLQESRRESDRRFVALDARIGTLVSAMGEYIRKVGEAASN